MATLLYVAGLLGALALWGAPANAQQPPAEAVATCMAHMIADGRMTGRDLPDKARGGEYSELVTVRYDLDGAGEAGHPRIAHGSPRGSVDPITTAPLRR